MLNQNIRQTKLRGAVPRLLFAIGLIFVVIQAGLAFSNVAGHFFFGLFKHAH